MSKGMGIQRYSTLLKLVAPHRHQETLPRFAQHATTLPPQNIRGKFIRRLRAQPLEKEPVDNYAFWRVEQEKVD